jgi:hypothetical protein
MVGCYGWLVAIWSSMVDYIALPFFKLSSNLHPKKKFEKSVQKQIGSNFLQHNFNHATNGFKLGKLPSSIMGSNESHLYTHTQRHTHTHIHTHIVKIPLDFTNDLIIIVPSSLLFSSLLFLFSSLSRNLRWSLLSSKKQKP